MPAGLHIDVRQQIVERAPADDVRRIIRRRDDHPGGVDRNRPAVDRDGRRHRPVGRVVVPVVRIVEAVGIAGDEDRRVRGRRRIAGPAEHEQASGLVGADFAERHHGRLELAGIEKMRGTAGHRFAADAARTRIDRERVAVARLSDCGAAPTSRWLPECRVPPGTGTTAPSCSRGARSIECRRCPPSARARPGPARCSRRRGSARPDVSSARCIPIVVRASRAPDRPPPDR